MDNKNTKNKEKKEVKEYKKDTQGRDWVFCVNNPKMTEDGLFEYLKTLTSVKYFCFGREMGDGTHSNPVGTEHHQGYIEFATPRHFSTVKNYFSEHAIGVNGNVQHRVAKRTEARDYVLKIGKHADKAHTKISKTYEGGEFIDDGERSDVAQLKQRIDDGATDRELADSMGRTYARCLQFVDRHRMTNLIEKFGNKRRLDLQVTYIHGKAGIGKTRWVMDKYGDGNVYRVSDYDSFLFDRYNNEDIIIFEEFYGQVKMSLMLNYLDIYPLWLRARYNNKLACYTKVFIISNIPLNEQYKNVQTESPEIFKAFLRRIHQIFNFNISKDVPVDIDGDITPVKVTQAALIPVDDEDLPF